MSLKSFIKWLLYPGTNLGVRSRRGIIKQFLDEPNTRTLDVGSGNGFFASNACRKGSSVLSVSFDPEQIERCREFKPYMKCKQDQLDFRVMNAESMDEMEEQFEQVLLLEVIEHLDDDVGVVTKLAQRLKPGGVMHITTPVRRFGYWTGVLDRMGKGGHCRLGYTDDNLERLIDATGMEVAYHTRLGGLGMFLTPYQSKLWKLLGGSLVADVIAFSVFYPIYLMIEWMPIPQSWRMIHYAIARRPVHTACEQEKSHTTRRQTERSYVWAEEAAADRPAASPRRLAPETSKTQREEPASVPASSRSR